MTADGRVKNNGKKTGRPQCFMHGMHERIKYAKRTLSILRILFAGVSAGEK
jgi:hypothetical protein